jgi:CDP-diacylglycerol pyrophosphatase
MAAFATVTAMRTRAAVLLFAAGGSFDFADPARNPLPPQTQMTLFTFGRLMNSRLRVFRLAAIVLLVAVVSAATAAGGAPPRDRNVLWKIVGACLDPEDADYCRRCMSPLAGSACAGKQRCEHTTELWEETDEFIAMRDIKMCSCPAGFVHGLAVPRAAVRGVEAPQLPQRIWPFAWAVARRKIGDPAEIALVVNSARQRSQDQLHLHLVRLRSDARRNLSGRMASIAGLDDVWSSASRLAAGSPPLDDYSVLVASDLKGGYLVLVAGNDRNLERSMTQRTCE